MAKLFAASTVSEESDHTMTDTKQWGQSINSAIVVTVFYCYSKVVDTYFRIHCICYDHSGAACYFTSHKLCGCRSTTSMLLVGQTWARYFAECCENCWTTRFCHSTAFRESKARNCLKNWPLALWFKLNALLTHDSNFEKNVVLLL